MIKVWVDSSYDDKRNIVGVGIVVQDGNKRRTYSNWTKARSNNAGELIAIHIGSILTHGQGIIYTDSQTAINYINKQIKDKPRTTDQYLNHKECEYWACQIRRRGIKVEKIKAHQHNFQTHSIGNRLSDLLAAEGRGKFYER